MCTSLDDIWDLPVEPSPPRPTTNDDLPQPSPSKKRRLFAPSDSDEEMLNAEEPSTANTTKSTNGVPAHVNALFDLDDDDDDGGFAELRPALDKNALLKDSMARNAKSQPPIKTSTTSALPDSTQADGDGDDDTQTQEGGKKKRKPLPKLDEARLLGTDGFPALVQQLKDWKPKGKGHEVSDLNKLMHVYQFWAHKMFPKGQFRDTIQRVEKICHSKRMIVALSVWRDESKGLLHGRKIDDPIDLTDDEEEGDDANAEKGKDDDNAGGASQEAQATSSSNPNPPPPSSSVSRAASLFDDDEPDMDAMIQEDLNQRAANSAATKQTVPDITDEDEAMWASFNDIPDDTDFGMSSTGSKQVKQSPPTPIPDEDEEMWDMFRDIEAAEEAAAKAKKELDIAKVAEDAQGTTDVHPAVTANADEEVLERRPTNDEGWDEMYE